MFTESEVFESPKALAKALSEKAEASYDTEIERIEKLLENFFESQNSLNNKI